MGHVHFRLLTPLFPLEELGNRESPSLRDWQVRRSPLGRTAALGDLSRLFPLKGKGDSSQRRKAVLVLLYEG